MHLLACDMADVKSRWLEAMDWLQAIDHTLPQEWPTELSPETAPDFWRHAAELEMQYRGIVSIDGFFLNDTEA
jgi:hypothetical protein